MSCASAIDSVFRGAYLLALSSARLGMLASHQRAVIDIDLDPQIAEFDVSRFRRVLQTAREEPVRGISLLREVVGLTNSGKHRRRRLDLIEAPPFQRGLMTNPR
jgi:hypothetical protein